MNGKKRSFWILSAFFGLMIIAGLVINFSTIGESMSMMGTSMGGMMKMHAANVKPADLLTGETEDHGMGDMSGHHELPPIMQSLSFFTTLTIFMMIPLLLGGVMLLVVLWV